MMKEINYDNYFWQEDNVRLRALKFEDIEGGAKHESKKNR